MKKLIKLTATNGDVIYLSKINKIYEGNSPLENETEKQTYVNNYMVKETAAEVLALIAESNGDGSISQIERDYSETLIKLHDLERMFETEISDLKNEINGLQREKRNFNIEILKFQNEIENFKKIFGNIDTEFTEITKRFCNHDRLFCEIETRFKNFEA